MSVHQVDVTVAKQVQNDPSLTPSEKSSLMTYLTQRFWTRTKLAAAGYNIDTTCPCGHERDGMAH
eukprot:8830092-Pyramimonas_sp.AAC.1